MDVFNFDSGRNDEARSLKEKICSWRGNLQVLTMKKPKIKYKTIIANKKLEEFDMELIDDETVADK